MALLHHIYDRQADGALLCPMTRQRLSVRASGQNRFACRYEDAEIAETFEAELLGKEDHYGPNLLVNWSQPAAREVRGDYGRWRRLTWFLLDALLVWLREEQQPVRSVLVLGGWLGGRYLKQARFMSSIWYEEGGRDALTEEVRPYAVYPLGGAAPRWSYQPGLQGAREGRVALLPEPPGELPLADLSRPIADQFADVPRFVADDGSIFFFHRVVPHVGPEYAPGLNNGLATQDYVFYFSDNHGSLSGKPIRLRPDARPEQAVLREEPPSYLQNRPELEFFRLHPMLREAQYFAGAEAQAILFNVPYEHLPEMRSIEFDQPHRFGSRLNTISEPPMSVGLPFSQLTSLPRLSHEPDERVRDGARPARGTPRSWKAFMDWRMRLPSSDCALPRSE